MSLPNPMRFSHCTSPAILGGKEVLMAAAGCSNTAPLGCHQDISQAPPCTLDWKEPRAVWALLDSINPQQGLELGDLQGLFQPNHSVVPFQVTEIHKGSKWLRLKIATPKRACTILLKTCHGTDTVMLLALGITLQSCSSGSNN